MLSLFLRSRGHITSRERVKQIIAQLIGIGGAKSVGFGDKRVRSLPDAVAKILAKHFSFKVNGIVEDNTKAFLNGQAKTNGIANGVTNWHIKEVSLSIPQKEEEKEVVVLKQLTIENQEGQLATEGLTTGLFDICPDCGSGSLAYEEGCRKCYSCGYSEC